MVSVCTFYPPLPPLPPPSKIPGYGPGLSVYLQTSLHFSNPFLQTQEQNRKFNIAHESVLTQMFHKPQIKLTQLSLMHRKNN